MRSGASRHFICVQFSPLHFICPESRITARYPLRPSLHLPRPSHSPLLHIFMSPGLYPLLISHHHSSFSALIHAEPCCVHPVRTAQPPHGHREEYANPFNDCSPALSCNPRLDQRLIQILFFSAFPLPHHNLAFEVQSSPAHLHGEKWDQHTLSESTFKALAPHPHINKRLLLLENM